MNEYDTIELIKLLVWANMSFEYFGQGKLYINHSKQDIANRNKEITKNWILERCDKNVYVVVEKCQG